VIQAQHLEFGYRRSRPVLRDFGLAMAPGRIYGLLGKNGEGKTTFLKLVCGLRHGIRGGLQVLGLDPAARPAALLREICLLPEEVPVQSVSAARFGQLRGPFYPRFSGDTYRRLLGELEVPADQSLAELSHGQRKKAALAFVLATDCRLLLLDEPTNGLDIPSKSVFRRLVANCVTRERCIVISTHQVRDVEDLIGSVAIVNGGAIVLQASLADVGKRLAVSAEAADGSELYAEDGAGGRRHLVRGETAAGSRVDLEFLFNATIHNSAAVAAAIAGEARQ